MVNETKFDLFIPALALEHFENSSSFNLLKKIEIASLRYYMNGDFFLPINTNQRFFIFVNKKVFNKEALGYEVSVLIRGG